MGLYYLQSRYYDPELCRFLNADAFISTGQGELGNNMFVYCNNNPVNFHDASGQAPAASCHMDDPIFYYLELWGGSGGGCTGGVTGSISTTGTLCVLAGILALSSDNSLDTVLGKSDLGYAYQPPNNDDDDDDDYFDDDENFGGRIKIGKAKGKTPGDNQRQNRQFREATKGLSKAQKDTLHHRISGKGLDFHEIVEEATTLIISIISGLLGFDD